MKTSWVRSSASAAASPLSELLSEAEKNNPQIQAAQQGTQAAKKVPAQVTALPEPMSSFSRSMSTARGPSPATPTVSSHISALGPRRIFPIQASSGSKAISPGVTPTLPRAAASQYIGSSVPIGKASGRDQGSS